MAPKEFGPQSTHGFAWQRMDRSMQPLHDKEWIVVGLEYSWLKCSNDANNLVSSRGGTPLYKLYRHVPPHRVGVLRRLGLKTGIHFAHFGLESGMVFEGTTGVNERIYRFNSKWVRKKEKRENSKWIWIIFLFAL